MNKIKIPTFKKGQTVKFSVVSDKKCDGKKKKTIEGMVLYVSTHHITLKCKNYNSAINFADIRIGDVELVEIKN